MKTITYLKDIDYAALRRGHEEVEYEDTDEIIMWPRCEITDCKAFICIGMSKSLCYPHGIEFKAFTKEEFEKNRKEKFSY